MVLSCTCTSLPQLLLCSGLFPTAPSQPHLAISVELLAFYQALFEHSCDLINALWYNILQVHIECCAKSIIKHCHQTVLDHLNHMQSAQQPSFTVILPSSEQFSLSQLCFTGHTFGWLLSDGGDIHITLDGNFHHCHWCSAGSCPAFYDPTYFIPKVQVNNVGCWIEQVHKWPLRQQCVEVPDEAIDQSDSNKQKAAMDCFDDTGIMALICHHDIPLFFANINMPGEQQKYSVALLEHLFSHLPVTATVVALYDIGCILTCSLDKFEILNNEMVCCIHFATTAMHTYGHKWACQHIYNPHITTGLSLSDGEGTEHLWSHFTKLIGVEQASSARLEMKGIAKQGSEACQILGDCGIDILELQNEWASQCSAQLSIWAHKYFCIY
ncbi:hypothetical protein F5J12DRAFT_907598 [Pisolithus orientalis]|uniref:uncharacterized protein n=1 Tax=Pisolithus orientalis TaxID=936130 RepID=UPI002225145F|nr:uncharacterized protein F5J12DRAFT_907598 [Pisolithus orientalis]KAI5990332.1 hypothetical protein F5J12DRAFT_907598 [Pisolithus orientalis]